MKNFFYFVLLGLYSKTILTTSSNVQNTECQLNHSNSYIGVQINTWLNESIISGYANFGPQNYFDMDFIRLTWLGAEYLTLCNMSNLSFNKTLFVNKTLLIWRTTQCDDILQVYNAQNHLGVSGVIIGNNVGYNYIYEELFPNTNNQLNSSSIVIPTRLISRTDAKILQYYVSDGIYTDIKFGCFNDSMEPLCVKSLNGSAWYMNNLYQKQANIFTYNKSVYYAENILTLSYDYVMTLVSYSDVYIPKCSSGILNDSNTLRWMIISELAMSDSIRMTPEAICNIDSSNIEPYECTEWFIANVTCPMHEPNRSLWVYDMYNSSEFLIQKGFCSYSNSYECMQSNDILYYVNITGLYLKVDSNVSFWGQSDNTEITKEIYIILDEDIWWLYSVYDQKYIAWCNDTDFSINGNHPELCSPWYVFNQTKAITFSVFTNQNCSNISSSIITTTTNMPTTTNIITTNVNITTTANTSTTAGVSTSHNHNKISTQNIILIVVILAVVALVFIFFLQYKRRKGSSQVTKPKIAGNDKTPLI